MSYNEPLHPKRNYHIFNHAVGEENLFRNDDNYQYFLKKFGQYISPVAGVYAYCLLPNHFHFLIQVKAEIELKSAFQEKYKEKETVPNFYPGEFVMQCFSNLFNAYAKAYNKRYSRKGALFMDYMKRREVNSDVYFNNVVHYIHNNAVHHGICKNVNEWNFSSYHSIISEKRTLLMREEVLTSFNGRENYLETHKKMPKEKMVDEMEFT